MTDNTNVTYGDNPAQRLLDLLASARGYGNQPPRSAWAAIFEVPDSDLGEILRLGAVTYGLALETRTQVENCPDDDPALVLQNFGGVTTTVINFQNLGALPTMAQFLQPYDSLAEYSLRLAASLLRRRKPETVLTDASLQALLDQTRVLIDSVSASEDIESDLRVWMIDMLREVETALLSVRVSGTSGVERATDRMMGATMRSSKFWRFPDNPAWVGIIALIGALNLALGTAVEFEQLMGAERQQVVIRMIEPPTQNAGPANLDPGP